MMRGLLIIAGLMLGLGTVLIFEGRMVHLRAYLPGLEPEWSRNFTPASGVFSGEALTSGFSLLPGSVTLTWRFEHVDKAGPVWQIRVLGDGVSARGRLRLAPGLGSAELSGGTGEIALDQLPQIADGFRASGNLVIEDARAGFSFPGGQIRGLHGRAQWIGARIDGQEIGEGEISLVSGDAGGWRAPFALSGDVVRITGQLEGRFGLPQARLEITIEDAGMMPDGWKRTLGQQVQRGENGWTIRREVSLTGGWPIF